MKSIDELNLPEDCRYDQDHGWDRPDGEKVRIGISDYAQDQLAEIVYVELPLEQLNLSLGEIERLKEDRVI